MWFQDLSSGPQFLLGSRKAGRYVHVGDLREKIDEIVRQIEGKSAVGLPEGVDPEYVRGAAVALRLLSGRLAQEAAVPA